MGVFVGDKMMWLEPFFGSHSRSGSTTCCNIIHWVRDFSTHSKIVGDAYNRIMQDCTKFRFVINKCRHIRLI
jgi:hypothetical protein